MVLGACGFIAGAPLAIVPVGLLMPLVFIGGLLILVDAPKGVGGTIPYLVLVGFGLFALLFLIWVMFFVDIG